jgi:hypothetical protein
MLRVTVMVCWLATACATVRPYERETLAKRAMSLDADPLAAEMEAHVHDYREGASGGWAGGGGGCGCN